MVMVDSSVWIDVLRGAETRQTELFERLAAVEEIGIADLSLFEVLQGVKPESSFDKVYSRLREFAILPVGGEDLAVSAARRAQSLRKQGVQPSTVDCLLAAYCIEHDIRFLTSDRDFESFARHLGLSLII